MVSGEPGSDPRSAEPFAFTDSDERPLGQVMRTPARTRTPQPQPRCAQPSPLGHNVRSSRADDYYLTEGAGLAERYVACPLSTDAADFGTIRVDRQMSRRATSEQVTFVERRRRLRRGGSRSPTCCSTRSRSTSKGSGLTRPVWSSPARSPHRSGPAPWTGRGRSPPAMSGPRPHRTTCGTTLPACRSRAARKKLQALLGHKSAIETWDTYGHLIGDEDDRSRWVIQEALASLADCVFPGQRVWSGRAGL